MTIERLSISQGVSVNSETEIILFVTKNIRNFRVLTEDEIIEPRYLKRYNYKRGIKLSTTGDSALISPNESEKAAKFDATNVRTYKDGSFRLAEPNDMFAVVGPGARKGEVRLYEFIRYVLPPKAYNKSKKSF